VGGRDGGSDLVLFSSSKLPNFFGGVSERALIFGVVEFASPNENRRNAGNITWGAREWYVPSPKTRTMTGLLTEVSDLHVIRLCVLRGLS
jgi:hypothetical protein